jgi:hypothetical protein
MEKCQHLFRSGAACWAHLDKRTIFSPSPPSRRRGRKAPWGPRPFYGAGVRRPLFTSTNPPSALSPFGRGEGVISVRCVCQNAAGGRF